MSGHVNFSEEVARRKLGRDATWLMHTWSVVGNTRDVIITGGVPVGTYKSGSRKGRPKWVGRGEQCVVTPAEEDAEKAAYELATGHCAECQGDAQTWAGWNRETGSRYRPCRKCNATGIAKATQP